jgi:hypothetical protein
VTDQVSHPPKTVTRIMLLFYAFSFGLMLLLYVPSVLSSIQSSRNKISLYICTTGEHLNKQGVNTETFKSKCHKLPSSAPHNASRLVTIDSYLTSLAWHAYSRMLHGCSCTLQLMNITHFKHFITEVHTLAQSQFSCTSGVTSSQVKKVYIRIAT